MSRSILFFLLTVSFVLPAFSAEPPVLHCPADPPAVRTLELVERWRISADDEDAPLIGVISLVKVREPGGDLYLLDRQLCQVLRYTADGEHVDTLGREGEGPGEFRRPYDLIVMDDGRLAVKNGWPSKLVFLNPDGTPGGSWTPKATLSLGHLRRIEGGWLTNGWNRDEERSDETKMISDLFIARFDDEGEQVQDYLTGERVNVYNPPTNDERGPYFPYNAWDLTSADEIVVSAARDEYRLEFYGLDGTLRRVVERDFESYRRTGEDKQEIRDGSRVYRNGVKQEMVFHLLDTEPAISWVRAQDDGRIWVGTCWSDNDLPEDVVIRFDVHGTDGALLEHVRVTGDCDLEYDRLRILPDGRAIVLRNYQAAIRTALNMLEEDDDVREDSMFEIIVCDLVEQ